MEKIVLCRALRRSGQPLEEAWRQAVFGEVDDPEPVLPAVHEAGGIGVLGKREDTFPEPEARPGPAGSRNQWRCLPVICRSGRSGRSGRGRMRNNRVVNAGPRRRCRRYIDGGSWDISWRGMEFDHGKRRSGLAGAPFQMRDHLLSSVASGVSWPAPTGPRYRPARPHPRTG